MAQYCTTIIVGQCVPVAFTTASTYVSTARRSVSNAYLKTNAHNALLTLICKMMLSVWLSAVQESMAARGFARTAQAAVSNAHSPYVRSAKRDLPMTGEAVWKFVPSECSNWLIGVTGANLVVSTVSTKHYAKCVKTVYFCCSTAPVPRPVLLDHMQQATNARNVMTTATNASLPRSVRAAINPIVCWGMSVSWLVPRKHTHLMESVMNV